jgi:hypothetical protein
VSAGFPGEPGRREPGLEHLIRALTADGDPRELADRDAAAAMFRASVKPAPGRPRRWQPRSPFHSVRAAVAAGVIVAVVGTTAAAYAAVLPAPVQYIAHSVLAPLGVPDGRPRAAPGGAPRRTVPDGPSTTVTGSPTASRSGRPVVPPRQVPADSSLTLTAASAQVTAGGPVLLKGRITYHGAAEPGIRVRLLKRAAGQPGWRPAGTGVSGSGGYVPLTVPCLAGNAAFRLAADDASSLPVTLTVIPRVVLRAMPGSPGSLRASAQFGDPGDTMVLQKLLGGTWINVASQRLGAMHWATFTVPANSPAGLKFRVVLEATGEHAAAVSDEVSLPRTRGRG